MIASAINIDLSEIVSFGEIGKMDWEEKLIYQRPIFIKSEPNTRPTIPFPRPLVLKLEPDSPQINDTDTEEQNTELNRIPLLYCRLKIAF